MSLAAAPRPRLAPADLLALALGLVLFAVLTYFAVAQHLTFHTRARDMGIYVQVLWNAAQGRPFVSTLLQENTNHLAEHVAPALWPLAPLAGIAPDAVPLLVVQQAFLAACALPIYLVARARAGPWPALVVLVGFALMPALSRVSLSEFHPIKLAALPIAAGAALVLLGRPRSGALLLLCSLLFEEETSPTVAGAGAMLLVVALLRRSGGAHGHAPATTDAALSTAFGARPCAPPGRLIGLGLLLLAIAACWALLTIAVLMPAFRQPPGRGESTTNRTLSHYEQVQREPAIAWTWLTTDRGPDALSWLILPHAGLALLAPEVLLAALPGFVALFLQDRPSTYAGHWSAPILPLIWLAVAVALGRLSRSHALTLPLTLALLLVGTASAYALDSYFPGGREYEADHYYATALEADLRRAVDLVPPGASFGGTRRVVPHLAARRDLYQYPFTFYNSPLRPDSQRLDSYILDLTDSPTRRAVEPAEADSLLEKKPRHHVRRLGSDVLLLSKARPEPLVARGESFGGVVRLVGLDWLDPSGQPSAQLPTGGRGGPKVGVRLYWEVVGRAPAAASRVARLRGPSGPLGPEVVGQPLDEYLPLDEWERGQVVAEELRFHPDPSGGVGDFRLLVGWRGSDGRPLPVDSSGAPELEVAVH